MAKRWVALVALPFVAALVMLQWAIVLMHESVPSRLSYSAFLWVTVGVCVAAWVTTEP